MRIKKLNNNWNSDNSMRMSVAGDWPVHRPLRSDFNSRGERFGTPPARMRMGALR